MQTINVENGVVIRSWCPQIEESALEQMKVLARLPFARYCALMPDAHFGKNMPIGGVLATDSVVIPDAVGSDIGCGMAAMKTSLCIDDITQNDKQQIHKMIENVVPVGFRHNTDGRRAMIEHKYCDLLNNLYAFIPSVISVVERKEFASQLGTLGGG